MTVNLDSGQLARQREQDILLHYQPSIFDGCWWPFSIPGAYHRGLLLAALHRQRMVYHLACMQYRRASCWFGALVVAAFLGPWIALVLAAMAAWNAVRWAMGAS
jgi:hypothetical protein